MMLAADLFKPFEFEFFRNGVIVATLAGALCGVVGCYVVLRNMSYIGHGLSHAIFGGYAVAGLIGINLFLGAGAWGVITALAIGGIVRRRPIGSDAAIGVVTTASFALGLALVQLYGSPGQNADALLFGNVLGVTFADVWLIVAVSIGAALFIGFGYRQLLFTTFDTEVAKATGVRTGLVDGLLMVLLSATVLATMNVMGVTLIAANLVVPAVVARMLTAHHRPVPRRRRDRRGQRFCRHERELSPRCRVRPDDRSHSCDFLHRGVRCRWFVPSPCWHCCARPLMTRHMRMRRLDTLATCG